MITTYIISEIEIAKLLQGGPILCGTDRGIGKTFKIEIAGSFTNGDVVKALFPNAEFAECKNTIVMRTNFFGLTHFDKTWWNVPYERKGEQK